MKFADDLCMKEREKKSMQHTQREKERIELERSEHHHSFCFTL
jgi:hypothetical protein